jgi:hypothetical protein
MRRSTGASRATSAARLAAGHAAVAALDDVAPQERQDEEAVAVDRHLESGSDPPDVVYDAARGQDDLVHKHVYTSPKTVHLGQCTLDLEWQRYPAQPAVKERSARAGPAAFRYVLP